MKKFVFLLLLSLFAFNANATNTDSVDVVQYIVSFLKKHAPCRDLNPSQRDKTEVVNALFVQTVVGFSKFDEAEKSRLRTKAFLLLYDNASFEYEDSPDLDRMHTRRSLCFMTISLLSDNWRYLTFVEYAMIEASRTRSFSRSKRVLLVHLTEYLLMHHFNYPAASINEVCKKMRDFFIARKNRYCDDGDSYFYGNFADAFSILLQKLSCE